MQGYIAPQIALRKGYPILTVVKYIKYSKEKSVGSSRVTLRAFKQKGWPSLHSCSVCKKPQK